MRRGDSEPTGGDALTLAGSSGNRWREEDWGQTTCFATAPVSLLVRGLIFL